MRFSRGEGARILEVLRYWDTANFGFFMNKRPRGDAAPSSNDLAAAAEAARKAAKLQAMREKLAAAGLPTPD